MLADKDRIFRNLYGFHDWGLKGARDPGQLQGPCVGDDQLTHDRGSAHAPTATSQLS